MTSSSQSCRAGARGWPRTRCAIIAILGLGLLAGIGGAAAEAADDPRIGLVSSYDEPGRITWQEPLQDFQTPRDFTARAVLGEGDDGRKSLALRVERKSENGIRLRSLEFRIDGASTIRSFKRKDVRTDRNGCRVAERVFLKDEETLVRSIAAAGEVEVVVFGARSMNTYRLLGPELEEFRRMVRIHDMPGAPAPPSPEKGSGAVVSNPELIRSTLVEPVFPAMAISRIARGLVILQAVIRKDGTVGDIQVLRSTACDCGFEAAAIAAVSKWRYTPGMQDGKPVDVYFTIEVNFKYEYAAKRVF